MNNSEMVYYAIEYARMGLSVFPLREKGKAPILENTFNIATTNEQTIRAWWKRFPRANIGIATGEISKGVFVIDLDIDADKGFDGYHTLKDWQAENGFFPETVQSITGRGGYHLFFKSEKKIKTRCGIMDGIDVRGEGGYIVAPPSVHQNGRAYEWEVDFTQEQIQEADDSVLRFLDTKETETSFKIPEDVIEGSRNHTLFCLASSLQTKGLADETILLAVERENQIRCSPPLQSKEVETIVKSALKYEKLGMKVIDSGNGNTVILDVRIHKDGTESVKQTIDNVIKVLEHDKLLAKRIKWNTLSYSPYVFGSLPWTKNNDNFREWSNADDSNLRHYMEKEHELSIAEKITDALKIVSDRNRFNPVVHYLEQLPEWDGAKRVDTLLSDYLGVEKTEYSVETMKLFMLGAISRAYTPGCKFDYMLIIIGEQGLGKSTFLKVLSGNDDWFNDNFNTIEGDKAPEKLRGMWIVEFSEMLATKRAKDVEAIKAFITSSQDTYRPPYERRTEQRPRACVFSGTTNNENFMTDRTGNRRYLPVVSRKEFVKKDLFADDTSKYFMQAWAEMMEYYKDKKGIVKLVMPENLKLKVEEEQQRFTEEDSRIGIIQNFLDKCKTDRVCIAEIREKAFDSNKTDKRESNELHAIMKNDITGWQRVKNTNGGRCKMPDYGTQICYDRILQEEPFEKCDNDIKMMFDK